MRDNSRNQDFAGHWVSVIGLTFITFLCASVVLGGTYYVSNYGSNGNSGLSPGAAWKTIQYGLDHVYAGDTLFIMANTGDYTGCGSNVGVAVRHSGHHGNFLVIKGYGGIPVINGQRNRCPSGDRSYGIAVHELEYIIIDSVMVKNIGQTSPSSCYEAAGFWINFSEHIILKDCVACSVTSCCRNGNCEIGSGIGIQDSRYCIVKRCKAFSITAWQLYGHFSDSTKGGGIYCYSNRYNTDQRLHWNLIDSCECWDNGEGITLSKHREYASHNTASHNICHDNYIGYSGMSDSCTFKYNVAYDNQMGIWIRPGYYGPVYGDSIYNNTVVNSREFDISWETGSSYVGDMFTVFNNICASNNGGSGLDCNQIVRTYGGSRNHLYIDYNCYYDSHSNYVVYDLGSYTLEGWVAKALGLEWVHGKDQHSLNVSPMFVDEAHHDYRLASGSPCIGTGKGGVDMGAYPGQGVAVRRGDIDRIIREHKEGTATEEEVKTYIRRYWTGE